MNLKRTDLRRILPSSIVLVMVLLQFGRILAFVDRNGGLIQDSGWSLGIARSLAERGTYTTMVATFALVTIRFAGTVFPLLAWANNPNPPVIAGAAAAAATFRKFLRDNIAFLNAYELGLL